MANKRTGHNKWAEMIILKLAVQDKIYWNKKGFQNAQVIQLKIGLQRP